MVGSKLREDQWKKILKFVRECPGVYAGKAEDLRRFIEGVGWMARSGAQWRELPERYGNWNTVYKRFSRWCEKGVWKQMHQRFAGEPDLEAVIPDSTTVRAHPCAAGAPAKRGGNQPRHWAEAGVASPPRFIPV